VEKGLKFLGVCILLSVIIISFVSIYKNPYERYKVESGREQVMIIDKKTGTIYYSSGGNFIEFNPITKTYITTKIR
jgi:hypothetical protein